MLRDKELWDKNTQWVKWTLFYSTFPKKIFAKEAFERGIYTDPQSSNSSNENNFDNYSDKCNENENIEEEYNSDCKKEYITENSINGTAFFNSTFIKKRSED